MCEGNHANKRDAGKLSEKPDILIPYRYFFKMIGLRRVHGKIPDMKN